MTNERDKNNKQIKAITWLGVFINIFLSAIKFMAGYFGESKAVIADAVHSLSDLSTDFAILLGVKFWTAPPDENHPYGHGRIESIITIIIGLILAAVAIGIGQEAVISIGATSSPKVSWFALIGPLSSIILKEFLFFKTKQIGEKSKSSALIANAWHHRSDSISSIPVLIAVIGSAINPKWVILDKIGAILVALFILKVSWSIIKSPLNELTDKSASELDLQKIASISESVEGIKEVHAIRTRKVNSSIHVDLHMLVNPDMSVKEGHDISETLQSKLIEYGPGVVDVVVHLEPFDS